MKKEVFTYNSLSLFENLKNYVDQLLFFKTTVAFSLDLCTIEIQFNTHIITVVYFLMARSLYTYTVNKTERLPIFPF